MPETPTPRLGLYRPKADGSENVNVLTDLNNNLDKIDQYVGFMTVPTQAARLAVAGFVGQAVRQADTGALYVLTALPASVAGNWLAVQTGAELTGPLVVADQAARDALVKANGLEVWRTDRKWLEVCDGAAWRVQGIAAVAAFADLATYITNPYQGQIATVTANSGGEYRYNGTAWLRHPGESEIRRMASLSIASGTTFAAVAFDDEGGAGGPRDPLGVWSAASPTRLICPAGMDGRWEYEVINLQWPFNATGSRAACWNKNGGLVNGSNGARLGLVGLRASDATETATHPKWAENMVGGDFMELYVNQTSGAASDIAVGGYTIPGVRVRARRIGPAL